MKRWIVVIVAVTASSCAHQTLNALDAESKADWQVCSQSVAKAQCGATTAEAAKGDVFGFGICVSPLLEQYSAATKAKRKSWLVRHGCPKDMVEAGDPEPERPAFDDDPD